MSHTSQGTAAKGLFMLFVFVVNNLSYFVVFPLAAWNHDFVLMVVSVVIPFVLGKVVQSMNGYSRTGKRSPKAFLLTALAGFLLWHHLWFLVIIFVIAAIWANTTVTTTRK